MLLLFPIILIESYFGDAQLLWAGIFLTIFILIIFPYIRDLSVRRRLPKEQHVTLLQSVILGISFLGHAYSMLGGVCKYFIDKIRSNSPPFPSTSVDNIEYSFVDGLKILGKYFSKNIGITIIMLLCLERGFFILRHMPLELSTFIVYVPILLTYSYVLFVSVLSPIILTPQLYMQLITKFKKS